MTLTDFVDPGWRGQVDGYHNQPSRWQLLRWRWADQLQAIAPDLWSVIEAELAPLEAEHAEMIDELRTQQQELSGLARRAEHLRSRVEDAEGAQRHAETDRRQAQADAREASTKLGTERMVKNAALVDAELLAQAIDRLVATLAATDTDQAVGFSDLLTKDETAAYERHTADDQEVETS